MFILGLDNAGKTTMLYRIQNNKIIQMAPSLVCFGIYNLFVACQRRIVYLQWYFV